MLKSPTFQEQWPATAEKDFFRGRAWQSTIYNMRKNECNLRIEDIYKKDDELYRWWTRGEPLMVMGGQL
jgi:hypothetical protein